MAQLVENPPANPGDARDAGLISRSGRPTGIGSGTHFCYLACRIPWTEKPGGLQSMESQRAGHL